MNTIQHIQECIISKSGTIGVLGQGYVGLPLALSIAQAGFQTFGFDVSRDRVGLLNKGKSHITDVSDDDLAVALQSGKYRATANLNELSSCQVVIICVPTPLRKTKDPDISYIVSAVESIKQYMR